MYVSFRFVWFSVGICGVCVCLFFRLRLFLLLSLALVPSQMCVGRARAYMDFCIRRDIGTKAIWQLPLSDCFVHVNFSRSGNITHITRKIIVWAVTTLHKSPHRPASVTTICAASLVCMCFFLFAVVVIWLASYKHTNWNTNRKKTHRDGHIE